MDLQLKGKCALITGGSEGIGKGIAMTLAKEGVNVAICARRIEPLEKTAEEIRSATGVTVVAIAADLTKDADAKNFVETAHKKLGAIDLMINNAGSAPGGVIETLTEATLPTWKPGPLTFALPLVVALTAGTWWLNRALPPTPIARPLRWAGLAGLLLLSPLAGAWEARAILSLF